MQSPSSHVFGFRLALVLAVAGVATAAALGSRLLHTAAKKNVPVASISAPRPAPQTIVAAAVDPQAPALPILLKPAGFVPREISRPAGPYYFAVGNLSGVREVALRLDREHGERLHQVNARREKPWRQIVHLAPGIYLLTEANHPEWVCRITITPR